MNFAKSNYSWFMLILETIQLVRLENFYLSGEVLYQFCFHIHYYSTLSLISKNVLLLPVKWIA